MNVDQPKFLIGKMEEGTIRLQNSVTEYQSYFTLGVHLFGKTMV